MHSNNLDFNEPFVSGSDLFDVGVQDELLGTFGRVVFKKLDLVKVSEQFTPCPAPVAGGKAELRSND